MLGSNPPNVGCIQYEEERAQDQTVWYTMPEWNEFRDYILEGYSLGPISEERSKPFQHRFTKRINIALWMRTDVSNVCHRLIINVANGVILRQAIQIQVLRQNKTILAYNKINRHVGKKKIAFQLKLCYAMTRILATSTST